MDAIGKQLYFYSQPALMNGKTILEYYQVTSLGFTIYDYSQRDFNKIAISMDVLIETSLWLSFMNIVFQNGFHGVLLKLLIVNSIPKA